MKKVDILMHLDDLMDTRMSTMLSINVAKATETIIGGYGQRRGDWVIWEGLGITEEAWRKAYKTRTNEILVRSVRSKLLGFINETLAEVIKNPMISDSKIPLTVTLNEYPYRLTTQAKKGLAEAVKLLTLPTLNVRWIRRSQKQLLPQYVADNHTHFIHYDMVQWLEEHINEPQGSNFVSMQMIAPSLFSHKPEDEDFSEFKGVLDSIHELGEYFISPSWTIKFISTEYFNAPY